MAVFIRKVLCYVFDITTVETRKKYSIIVTPPCNIIVTSDISINIQCRNTSRNFGLSLISVEMSSRWQSFSPSAEYSNNYDKRQRLTGRRGPCEANFIWSKLRKTSDFRRHYPFLNTSDTFLGITSEFIAGGLLSSAEWLSAVFSVPLKTAVCSATNGRKSRRTPVFAKNTKDGQVVFLCSPWRVNTDRDNVAERRLFRWFSCPLRFRLVRGIITTILCKHIDNAIAMYNNLQYKCTHNITYTVFRQRSKW